MDEDLNSEGDLDIVDALTIVGNGATIEQTCPDERVLHNVADTHLQLQDVTITGGDAENLNAPTFGNGGGVYSIGPLTLQGATVTGNAGEVGGGVAVFDSSEFVVSDSAITDNSGGSGGGVYASGPAAIRGSAVSDNVANGPGGGLSIDGPLVLEDSTVTGNTAEADGGGIEGNDTTVITRSTVSGNAADVLGYGGGVDVEADLDMTESTVSGNTAEESGGGIRVTGVLSLSASKVSGNTAGAAGGGIYTEGEGSQIADSEISDNVAVDGAGLYLSTTDVVIARSLVAGNSAEGVGGGIHSYESFVVANSTIVGNAAAEGGGIGMEGEDFRPTVDHVTLTSNSAPTGANISPGLGTVHATVVADPLGGGDNCTAPADMSAGYNVEVGTDTCGFAGTGDVASGPDPLLGALGDNGGPTHTRLPLDGSPLIDAVPADSDGCGGTDQRGVARPQFDGCDVGAVEVAPDPPPPAPDAGAPDPPGSSGSGSNGGSTPTTPAARAVAARPTFTG